MATTSEIFASNNRAIDLLNTDLHNPKTVRQLNWTGLDPEQALSELKALQRTRRIAPEPSHAQALLHNGFNSAHKVTSISKRQFVDEMAPALGSDGARLAAGIYEAAEQATNQVMMAWGLVNHLSSPHFKALSANHVSPDLTAYFEGMPGYQDFFGSLDYCDCEECKSIFGPAAYFVDLLRIIDKKVTLGNPDTIPAQMHLDERRPDLKLIPLSCENTNDVMPYINIVNQRLENALKPLGTGNDLYQKIAQIYFPFNLPFHLPLARIRASLAQFNISLADILRLLGADAAHVAAELIAVSPEEWALLTTSNTTDASLQGFYGIADLAQLNALDTFCKQTGLQILQVQDLFNQNLSDDELAAPPLTLGFFINQGQQAAPSITKGQIANLNNAGCDRIHRFIRLANTLGWSFVDLNWAIYAVHKGRGDIDPATLTALARTQELAQQYKLTVPDALTYLYDLKTIGRGKNPSSSEAPFDVVFNGAGQPPRHPKYAGNRLYTDPVDPWDSTKTDATSQKLSTWIAAGLGVREGDLKLLVGAFFNGKVDVSVENLSTLYRHARLARQLHFRMQDYLLFLDCFDLKKPLYSIEDLHKLFETFEILQRCRLNVYQLNYIVDANAPDSPYVPLPYQPDQLDHWFETLKKLIRKRDTRDVKARKLLTQLANLMHTDEKFISAILAVLSLDPADMATLALNHPDHVTPQIKNVSRWLSIVVRLKLTVDDLESVKASPTVYFSAPPWPAAGEVLDLFLFKEAQAKLDDVSEDLLAYMKADNDTAASANVLAGFLPLEEDQITTLLTAMSGDTRIAALRKIMQISDYSRSTGAGVPLLTSLKDLAGKGASTDWATYTIAAENLLAILRARTTAEAWTALYAQIDGRVQATLRTALVPTALLQLASKTETAWIKTDRNLYEYLLIDVGMSGCAQISYIKEGLNALQLYLHRCRERLEPGVEVLDIPAEWWEWIANYRIWEANRKIFLYPENYLDPSIRQSKTTLFKKLESSLNQGNLDPETIETAFRAYLDEFAELAKLVYVDAYYLNAAGATAAGCSTFTTGSTTSIFFFARTQDEPYKYYYIVWQPGNVWSEWQDVNIPIHARHITPVFAFDRMFLFWVEQRTQMDVDAKNQKISIVKATIKYSFYNFGGNWVQPQTLLGDTVLSLSGSEQPSNFNNLFTPEFFQAERLVWNKVYCLTIAPGQYDSLLGGANKAEKLVVFFGPVLNTRDFTSWQGPGNPPSSANPYLTELEGRLYNTALNFQKIKQLGFEGSLPAFAPIIRESDLQPNSLLSPNEIVFLRKDDTNVVNFFRESIDRASGRLNLLTSDQVINDNYDQERALIGAHADAKTPWVSGAMRNTNNGLFTIANHPAAFVFQGDRESFLLQDPSKNTSSVSQMVFNADTLFNANSFNSIPGGISSAGSAALYQALIDAGYLQSNGVLTPGTELDDLAGELTTQLGNPSQEGVAKDILADTPVFKADSFITADIQKVGSQNIYDLLVRQGYLDAAGRLTADTDFYELTDDLKAQLGNDTQVRAVVTILFQSPWPSSLGLIRPAPGPALDTYQFTALRLTTAAVHRLSSTLFVGGVDKLLALPTQQIPVEPKLPYARLGFNASKVKGPDAPDGAEVDFDGAYGLYYWELFFHAPHLIFSRLNGELTFDQAEKWMKYIFDPTAPEVKLDKQSFVTSTIGVTISERIWQILLDQKLISSDGKVQDSVNRNTDLAPTFKSLGLNPNQIISILNILLNHQVSTVATRYWQFQKFRNQSLQSMTDQLTDTNAINAYHCHPFDPHAIARLRIGAYEKAAVMQYIDNLLDWGDMEFRRYTWESITTATMYYVYAWNLLGPRPQSVGDCTSVPPKSYADISAAYQGEIPEFLIQLETLVPHHPISLPKIPYNELDTYFCVPDNSVLVAFWDRVEDRLFKIRHCLNIDGLKVPLALFEPPIDPMALARAAAAGADVLALFGGGSPIDNYYRFSVLLDRTRAFTDTVTQFGATLLDVLEKNDAAALDRLRSTQEKAILNLTTQNLEDKIEAQKNLIEAATQAKEIAEGRQKRYQALIDGGWNAGERADVSLLTLSIPFVTISALCIQIAGPLKLLPKIFGLADGGQDVWGPVEASATALEQDGKILETLAEISAKAAEYQRREEEWEFERVEAREEAARIEKEIKAAEISRGILEHELAIHEKSIAQAEEYETFLKAKFTNQDLYQWMSSRVSTVYSQAYHLALDLAIKAQAAYQFELSSTDTFIQFDSWDSIHKGLLAGEGLTLALNQMEAAYLQNNVPRMQLEKEVSLLHLDPLKFMEFKTGINGTTKGTLNFSLTEALFDGDFPGHYDRRIKAISLTFLGAGLKGDAINATLVQNSSTVVLSDSPDAVGFLVNKQPASPPDGTIRTNWLAQQSVALSRKQNDAGLFVLDFRYPDDQFYPFEGTGAVSDWTLTVLPQTNRIDFNAISDIVVKLWYTSRDGGSSFASTVMGMYTNPPYPLPLARIIDVKAELGASNWLKFVSTPTDNKYSFEIPLADGLFITNIADVTLLSAELVLSATSSISDLNASTHFISLTVGSLDQDVSIANSFGTVELSAADLSADKITLVINEKNLPVPLQNDGKLDPGALKNLFIAIRFNSTGI